MRLSRSEQVGRDFMVARQVVVEIDVLYRPVVETVPLGVERLLDGEDLLVVDLLLVGEKPGLHVVVDLGEGMLVLEPDLAGVEPARRNLLELV